MRRSPARPRKSKHNQRKKAPQNRLARNAAPLEVTISYLGGRGDGVAQADYTHNYQTKSHMVFVPNSLPGETVLVQPTTLDGQGIQAHILELKTASKDRKEPDCQAFPECGGCQFQHFEQEAYQAWKDNQLDTVLERAGFDAVPSKPRFTAPPHSRRRARLAFRKRAEDVITGFRQRATHHIIAPTGCVILAPELQSCLLEIEAKLLSVMPQGMTGDLDINLCDNGCDICVITDEPCAASIITSLTTAAADCDIARLSLQQPKEPPQLLLQKKEPKITWSLPEGASQKTVALYPAPATFLQAVSQAETVMRDDIFEALSGYKNIVDLFCGSGTLSTALLFQNTPPEQIIGYDTGREAIASFQKIADFNGHGNRLSAIQRNLFDAPLTTKELENFDAAIMDPPRSGAPSQAASLAKSNIKRIMMVSCNPYSFVKDAALLLEGGYQCKWYRHIDQFWMTSHSEIIACFDKNLDKNLDKDDA